VRSRWVWIFLSIALLAAVACGVVVVNRADAPQAAPAVAGTSERSDSVPGPLPAVAADAATPADAPDRTAAPAAASTTAVPAASTPTLATEDLALLATYGAEPGSGPRVAAEGDPETADLPTARDLDVLTKLPVDWATAMVIATRGTEGLGTPDAARGTFLSGVVSSELYQAWTESLNQPERRGTFTLRRFALAEVPEQRDAPLTFVGTGTFTLAATNEATPFIVSATVSRTNDGWRVSGVSYDRYEGAL